MCVDTHDIPVVAVVGSGNDVFPPCQGRATAGTGMDALTHAIEGIHHQGRFSGNDGYVQFKAPQLRSLPATCQPAMLRREQSLGGREGMAWTTVPVHRHGIFQVWGVVHSMAHDRGII